MPYVATLLATVYLLLYTATPFRYYVIAFCIKSYDGFNEKEYYCHSARRSNWETKLGMVKNL
jgi:uncharacterized membrane protein